MDRIAQILRPDAGSLSPEEVINATEVRISFGPSDMTIVDWDAAFVLDPDPEDVRGVLEFANVQLLEMRWLDLQLDDAIERSYQLLARRRGWRSALPSGLAAELNQVAELQLESAVLLERVTNALKVFGEEYLARIYRLAAGRFQLDELDATISRKLATIESIYQKLTDRATTVRMEVLEWVVIILIALGDRPRPAAALGVESGALGDQVTAIGLSAISYQLSAISYRLSAVDRAVPTDGWGPLPCLRSPAGS